MWWRGGGGNGQVCVCGGVIMTMEECLDYVRCSFFGRSVGVESSGLAWIVSGWMLKMSV